MMSLLAETRPTLMGVADGGELDDELTRRDKIDTDGGAGGGAR
jgi:hypothetical protein